jgi:putative phosphoesterase
VKLFFIADIHGSALYLDKALKRFDEEKADWLVILGDELYHGARNPLPERYEPKTVTAMLNARAQKIIAVRGNCDSEVDSMVLDFPLMSDYSVVLWENRRLFLTHGHIFAPDKLPPLAKGDVFLYGHTHVPVAYEKDGVFIINPGSVTFPKENSPRTYGVLEDGIFTIKTLESDALYNNGVYKSIELR